MTTGSSSPTTPTSSGEEHDWREAGDGWGHAAADWACLFEHYSSSVTFALFTEMGIGPGVDVLEVACGSGLVARLGAATGARWTGLDASAELLAIARSRSPEIDLREGSMFDLPFEDDSFDRVLAINGIWGGCDRALTEAHRVLRPGGLAGVSYWGSGPPLDMKECFRVFARHSPTRHRGSMKKLNAISFDGVAEQMMSDAGFEVVASGARISTLEWPDADLAWRALSSVGPAVPALRHAGEEVIRREVMAAIEPCRDERGGYRFANDHRYVVARKPG